MAEENLSAEEILSSAPSWASEIMTLAEVAALIRCPEPESRAAIGKVQKLVNRGLPVMPYTRPRLFLRSQVMAWLANAASREGQEREEEHKEREGEREGAREERERAREEQAPKARPKPQPRRQRPRCDAGAELRSRLANLRKGAR